MSIEESNNARNEAWKESSDLCVSSSGFPNSSCVMMSAVMQRVASMKLIGPPRLNLSIFLKSSDILSQMRGSSLRVMTFENSGFISFLRSRCFERSISLKTVLRDRNAV